MKPLKVKTDKLEHRNDYKTLSGSCNNWLAPIVQHLISLCMQAFGRGLCSRRVHRKIRFLLISYSFQSVYNTSNKWYWLMQWHKVSQLVKAQNSIQFKQNLFKFSYGRKLKLIIQASYTIESLHLIIWLLKLIVSWYLPFLASFLYKHSLMCLHWRCWILPYFSSKIRQQSSSVERMILSSAWNIGHIKSETLQSQIIQKVS